jgi:hypothetical protein
MSEIQLHVPVDVRDVPPVPLTPRPQSLEGLRIGLLDNGKEFSDTVLEGISEVLGGNYAIGEAVYWRKGFPAKGAPFIDDMAADVDVAISGVGH